MKAAPEEHSERKAVGRSPIDGRRQRHRDVISDVIMTMGRAIRIIIGAAVATELVSAFDPLEHLWRRPTRCRHQIFIVITLIIVCVLINFAMFVVFLVLVIVTVVVATRAAKVCDLRHEKPSRIAKRIGVSLPFFD